MKKGVVLEVINKKAIILKSDGCFQTLSANVTWKKGDLIVIPSFSYKKFGAIAASFLLLFLFLGVNLSYFTKSTVISLDINPSIEFNINKFGHVISVTTYNEEAEKIVYNMSVKNKKYEQLLEEMMQEEELGSYINQNSYMRVTIQSKNKTQEQEMLQQIKTLINTYITSHYQDTEIDYIVVDNQLLEEAHNHGVSAGVYSLLMELKLVDSKINIEDYIHHSVSELKEDIAHCHEEIKQQNGCQGGHCGGNNHH